MPLGVGVAVGAGAEVGSWCVASISKASLALRSAVSREQGQKDVLLTEASPELGVLPEAPVSFSAGTDFLVLEGAKSHPWLTRKWLHSRAPPHSSPK